MQESLVGKKGQPTEPPPPRPTKPEVNEMDKKLENRFFKILDEIYENILAQMEEETRIGPLMDADDAEAAYGVFLSLQDDAIAKTCKDFSDALKKWIISKYRDK